MNIKVRDYLQDLSKLNIPRQDGIILLDEEGKEFSNRKGTEYGCAYLINLNNQKYYIKYPYSKLDIDNVSINTESICSDVYNELGINCVDYYPVAMKGCNQKC